MRISLERLKAKSGEAWLNRPEILNRSVFIVSEGWYWRKNAAGYTDCKCSAGVYGMGDAWNRSNHCGEEKRVVYEFV